MNKKREVSLHYGASRYISITPQIQHEGYLLELCQGHGVDRRTIGYFTNLTDSDIASLANALLDILGVDSRVVISTQYKVVKK